MASARERFLLDRRARGGEDRLEPHPNARASAALVAPAQSNSRRIAAANARSSSRATHRQ